MNLFRKIKKVGEGIGAQLSTNDGGATFSSVMNRPAPQAPLATPPPLFRKPAPAMDTEVNAPGYVNILQGMHFNNSPRPATQLVPPAPMPQNRGLSPMLSYEDGTSEAAPFKPFAAPSRPFIGDVQMPITNSFNTGTRGRYYMQHPVQNVDPNERLRQRQPRINLL